MLSKTYTHADTWPDTLKFTDKYYSNSTPRASHKPRTRMLPQGLKEALTSISVYVRTQPALATIFEAPHERTH